MKRKRTSIKRVKAGLRSNIRGFNYENKILNILSKSYSNIQIRKKSKTQECDLIATKGKHILVVECKSNHLTLEAFIKFAEKLESYTNRHKGKSVTGTIYHGGKEDNKKSIEWIRKFLPNKLKNAINIRYVRYKK